MLKVNHRAVAVAVAAVVALGFVALHVLRPNVRLQQEHGASVPEGGGATVMTATTPTSHLHSLELQPNLAATEQATKLHPLSLPPSSLPPPLPPQLPPPHNWVAGVVSWPIVQCKTTKGDVTLRVRPDWSPLGAARYLDLVRAGYFTNNLFYRVPPINANPIYQFGIQPNKILNKRSDLTGKFEDDAPVRCDSDSPSHVSCHAEAGLQRSTGLRKGMLGFGGGGHSGASRTSHMWILRRDSSHLGKASWETPVAEVSDC